MENKLVLSRVYKNYGKVEAVKDISFDVKDEVLPFLFLCVLLRFLFPLVHINKFVVFGSPLLNTNIYSNC